MDSTRLTSNHRSGDPSLRVHSKPFAPCVNGFVHNKEAKMIQINLTQEEIQLLRGLLDTILEDLRVEIHATDKMEYKEMLKERKALLIKLMEALPKEQNLPLAD
jgi:hypothetical protein